MISLDPEKSLRAEVEFRDAIDHAVVVAALPLTIAYRVADDVLDIALWSTDSETVHFTAKLAVSA